jgi:putative oxidoreductase
MKPSPWLGPALRGLLAGIFLWAGASKAGASQSFAAEISRLQLVPFAWTEWLALSLPLVELLVGLWLLSPWRRQAAALAVMALASLFALSAGQALWRGLDLNCACFGPGIDSPPPSFVVARALLIGAAGTALSFVECRGARGVPDGAARDGFEKTPS